MLLLRTTMILIALAVALTSGSAVAQRTIEMEVFLHDNPLHIAPDAMNAETGDTVKLTVTNGGTIHHDLVVCGNADCSQKWGFIPQIAPGASAPLTFVAKEPGTFEYYCTITGHKAGGMRGQLSVQGEPSGGAETPGFAVLAGLAALGGAALMRRRETK